LTGDGARDRWKISGPRFAGWEIYHLNGSPAAEIRFASPPLAMRDGLDPPPPVCAPV
jgi:hypothetical protein